MLLLGKRQLIIGILALIVMIAAYCIDGRLSGPVEEIAQDIIEQEFHLPDGSLEKLISPK